MSSFIQALHFCGPELRHKIKSLHTCVRNNADKYKSTAAKTKKRLLTVAAAPKRCKPVWLHCTLQLAQQSKKPNTTWQAPFIYVAWCEPTFTACLPIKYTIKTARKAWQVAFIFCSVVSGGPPGLNDAYLTALLKQYEQKRCPHCAWYGLLRIFWQILHRCLSSSLLASIFLGKPGLLPSNEDGGEGSCAAIMPERACDQTPEKRRGSFYTFLWNGL